MGDWIYPRISLSTPTTCCRLDLGKHAHREHRTCKYVSGIILDMGSANEKRRYIVTSSLIGWAHTENDPCVWLAGSLQSRRMSIRASQITGEPTVCSTAYSGWRQRKLPIIALFGGIHRWPVDSPHIEPVMQTTFPCHNVITWSSIWGSWGDALPFIA